MSVAIDVFMNDCDYACYSLKDGSLHVAGVTVMGCSEIYLYVLFT